MPTWIILIFFSVPTLQFNLLHKIKFLEVWCNESRPFRQILTKFLCAYNVLVCLNPPTPRALSVGLDLIWAYLLSF